MRHFLSLVCCEAKPALLSFEDDQKLICNLWEENSRLKKNVRLSFTLLMIWYLSICDSELWHLLAVVQVAVMYCIW